MLFREVDFLFCASRGVVGVMSQHLYGGKQVY